jgi:UDP-N-acetylmuramyl tripeptide synthase
MQDFLGTITGKAIKGVLNLKGSGGQALPGLVIEKLFPGYVRTMLAQLPDGVVMITGTNGKTTTTKMVVHLLESNGKRVITNSTGSNLVRGIASSLSQHAKVSGRLPYDIAILEVDEAAARRLAEQIKPRWVLALNASRDQLDRFGEVDTIVGYIGSVMESATEGVITNANDPNLLPRAQTITKQKATELHLFGASDKLSRYFPSDYELAAVKDSVKTSQKSSRKGVGVELEDFRENLVKYSVTGKSYQVNLNISGQHNYLNGAAALALAGKLMPEVKIDNLLNQLAAVELAFGRGEKYKLPNGAIIELVLVKNPASFTQALASYGSSKASMMIAINDNIADGRDVSWLWDVNFGALEAKKIAITSGQRAADMALRLSYDDIKTDEIEPRLAKALDKLSATQGPKIVLATYTAMLNLYSIFTKTGQKVKS